MSLCLFRSGLFFMWSVLPLRQTQTPWDRSLSLILTSSTPSSIILAISFLFFRSGSLSDVQWLHGLISLLLNDSSEISHHNSPKIRPIHPVLKTPLQFRFASGLELIPAWTFTSWNFWVVTLEDCNLWAVTGCCNHSLLLPVWFYLPILTTSGLWWWLLRLVGHSPTPWLLIHHPLINPHTRPYRLNKWHRCY